MKKESIEKTKNISTSEKKLADKIGPAGIKQEKILTGNAHQRQDKSMKRED